MTRPIDDPDDDDRDWYEPDREYACAYCNDPIRHEGYDPCEVTVRSARDIGERTGMWVFWAHAACVPKAFEPNLRAHVAHEYEPGRVDRDVAKPS